jgi:hypothetical protein
VIDVAAVEQAFPKVQKLAPLAQSGQKDVLRGILDGELQAADAREEVRAASSFFVRTSNLDPNRTMMPAPAGGLAQADPHERQRFLMDALDRPIRVYWRGAQPGRARRRPLLGLPARWAGRFVRRS